MPVAFSWEERRSRTSWSSNSQSSSTNGGRNSTLVFTVTCCIFFQGSKDKATLDDGAVHRVPGILFCVSQPLCVPKRFLYHHYHHHYLSLNHKGRWGTTDDFATSFLHLFLFSIALCDLANSRPVHCLILSSHRLLCPSVSVCPPSPHLYVSHSLTVTL